MIPDKDFNACPPDLSPRGRKAWRTIMRVLRKHDMAHTGGCTTFYSPAQWKERGEADGLNIGSVSGHQACRTLAVEGLMRQATSTSLATRRRTASPTG